MLARPCFGMTTMALAVVVILLSGCAEQAASPGLQSTVGTLSFHIDDSTDVQIPAEWKGDTLILRNAEEEIALTPLANQSWTVPVFDGLLSLDGDTGSWVDVLRPGEYRVPVQWMSKTQPTPATWPQDTLSWALTFGADTPWLGQLYLQRQGDQCKGSIATATGDFRYLHGTLNDAGSMVIQTFDGAHLFLFSAELTADGSLAGGVFKSGNHYATSFVGEPVKAADSALQEAPVAKWTGLPVAYRGLSLTGDSVLWNAAEAEGRHVLSVMGSWCPNCMDEHRLLAQLLDRHPNLHVHTLAFERGLDSEGGTQQALERLTRYRQQMGLHRFDDRWTVVLAGPASKSEAQQALPFLNRVVSFPTTLVVEGTSSDAPWIHSGFNGPAMGPAHELEVARFAAALSGPTESR